MRRGFIAVLAVSSAFAGASQADAKVASGLLQSSNGENTYDATLECGVGDGPSWRGFWLDSRAASPGDLLLGTWDGTFEVHDAGRGKAFIPNGDGRISITLDRTGTGFFETRGNGDCANATLDLTTQADGDPQVSGTLPIVALGGTGAFRGLNGSGTASFSLELGPGADNLAVIDLTADLDVLDPQLTVTSASARYQNLTAYLQRKLTVTVNVANALGAGDAFKTKIVTVGGGSGSFSGIPTGEIARIGQGSGGSFTFTMNNANANTQYTTNVTLNTQDGLFNPMPPIAASVSFKSPLLP